MSMMNGVVIGLGVDTLISKRITECAAQASVLKNTCLAIKQTIDGEETTVNNRKRLKDETTEQIRQDRVQFDSEELRRLQDIEKDTEGIDSACHKIAEDRTNLQIMQDLLRSIGSIGCGEQHTPTTATPRRPAKRPRHQQLQLANSSLEVIKNLPAGDTQDEIMRF